MKRVKILVCGFSLAIALVVLPFPYIDDITSGLGFSIAAVLFAWLGILERRGAKNGYKRDVRLYSASTMMKVVHVEESEYDRWEDQPDGSSKLRREKVYLPTYEYSVNEKHTGTSVFSRFPVNEMWESRWLDIISQTGRISSRKTAQESQCLVDSYISTVLRSVCFSAL